MKLESSTKKTRILALFLGGMGAVILYLTKIRPTMSPNQSAFWLGVALLAVGAGVYLFDQAVTIELPDGEKYMKVTKTSVIGTTRNQIPFNRVSHVKVQRVGSKPPRSYHMIIFMKDGSKLRTGRWSFNQNEIYVEASALARLMGADVA